MKSLKKVMLIAALFLSGCLFAQTQAQAFNIDTSLNVTVQGKAGKMIIFKSLPNFSEFVLSRNGKFLMGRSISDEGDAGVGIIYEIATGKTEMVNGSVIEVVDWDNYLTTAYAKIDKKEYIEYVKTCNNLIVGVVEEASADLLTVRVSLYLTRKEYDYANVMIETKTGKILDTLKVLDPSYNGGMNMGWKMSDDAKIVGGRASLTGAAMNYAPVFWDLDRDAVYSLSKKYIDGYGSETFEAGQMWGVNGQGTILCGDIYDQACYIRYDRTTGEYSERVNIPREPGFSVSSAYRVNSNGVIVGTEQMEAVDILARTPFIYFTENDQKYVLADYLLNLYGLNSEQEVPLMTPTGISDDARFISGNTYDDATWYTYLIVLDEHQSPAPVRNVKVENLPRRSMNVVVSWQEPMKGEYTLTGYNIYRDKQKIGSVGVGDLTYTDEVPGNGKYKYFVQAVYGDKESDATDTLSIIVLNPDECLPVLEMFSSVEYNRTVSLAWNLPSDKETQNIISRPKSAAPKYVPQEGLDFVSVFQPVASRMGTGVRIGDYIYAGSYEQVGIFVYDQFGNTLKQIPVEGVGNIHDMTYHYNEEEGAGYFYVATGQERVLILRLNPDDPFDITQDNRFTTALNKTISITYVENDDPAVNEGEDYLIIGNYYKLVGYPVNATGPDAEFKLPVEFEINDMIISGTEYYKDRLYMSDQNGTNGCDLVAYDMATGKKLSTTDLYAHPTVEDAAMANGWPDAAYACGLVHSTLPDGTEILECLLQCTYTYNMIVDMELESSEDVLGYVVYRNGERVSDTLKARHFTEDIDSVGTYVYHIEYLSTRGCSSSSKAFDVTSTAVIHPKGEVAPPRGLRGYESNGKAVLTWSGECLYMGGFVGFNLYRDGKQIGEKNFKAVQYVDSEVEVGKKYQYRLSAFFDDSSEASDTVEVTLTGKGVALEPSVFRVEGTVKEDDNTVNAKASWGLPYFEEPMAYGYCSYPAGGNLLTGTSQMFCIIGWNSKDMDKFEEDLYLVGVEFAMACSRTDLKTMSTIVYVDDVMVYDQPYDDRFQPREWKRVYFDKVFKMKQEQEIAVGYSVSFDPDKITSGIFANDEGPGVTGKSDLVSMDGVDFGSLKLVFGVDVNLCINALVVRQRDFAEAAFAPEPQEYLKHKVMRMDLKAELGEGVKFTDGPKTTSEGIRLLGFNIYRDGEKLNKNMLTDFSYEENVARGDYEYEVGAVYDGADELKASFFAEFSTVGMEELQQAYQVSVYPNPASDILNIKGDYVSFMLVDMNGRVLMRDVRNTESVSLAGLNDGVYFMLITLPNGDKRAVKVIKR